jgi:ankyrin repeat protein
MGNGPLHVIARIGHYKYPPAGIPKLLIDSGVDVNAKNHNGATALDISLLSGWQKVYIALPSFGFHVLNQCEPTFA